MTLAKDELTAMVHSIINGDTNGAKESLHNALQIKMQDALNPSTKEIDNDKSIISNESIDKVVE